jgi:heptaprenyl diphosphate synthase
VKARTDDRLSIPARATGRGSLTWAAVDAGHLVPIRAELEEFERRLRATLHSDLGSIAGGMQHIVEAGGKRLRPALVLLTAGLGKGKPDDIYAVAMSIEFIHTATLVHDDLIDQAPTRRGLATLHAALGANPAIIIGDYYFGKGANLMTGIGDPRLDQEISRAVMVIAHGEMLELLSQRRYHQTVKEYLQRVEKKTAVLLGTSAYCSALVTQRSHARQEALRTFGRNLGMAFQIADDILDYSSSEAELGKPVGNDLKQGTVTLPLLYALEDKGVGPELRQVLRGELSNGQHAEVVELVRGSNGIERAFALARQYADRATAELRRFADGAHRRGLEALASFVVGRRN